MNKIFTFPGQGSQAVSMGKDFYDNFDIAKKVFQEVDETLGKSLSKIMFEGPQETLTDTENAQPAIMCCSIAMLRVLEQESGKKIQDLCKYVAGHSLGEYSALCASEALTLSDTARLLKIRGESFASAGKASKGGMVALLGATVEQANEISEKAKKAGEICQIANDNTIGQIVLSGHENSIDEAVKIATEMGVKKAIKLQVSGAFHSELMRPAVQNMEKALENIIISTPKVPLISNFTARATSNHNEIKENLINQITGGVRWRQTMLFCETNGIEEFVEIGNGKVLTGMVAKTCPNAKTFTINNIESLKEYLK
ncbi:MAG TPA: ACP S-malonyltransferase [Rickettsiales bacterium]|nr:ACP S-malonyltransferase [Rickettsiales bacterium]